MSEAGIDAFAELGLPRDLAIGPDQVREAFREAGKSRHPDAGGEAGDFARLQEAMAKLSDPGARLRHWLELEGIDGGMRGPLGDGLMDLFGQVGECLQAADALIRERQAASSALAKALLEGRVQKVRESLEAMQERIDAETESRCGDFAAVAGGEIDGWLIARELAFLGKWRAQIRERYGALW